MDKQQFAAEVERLKPRLYRITRLYLDSEAMAVEAVDEAVYQALRSLKKLRQPEYFATWLTRILINECQKELRRRRREQPLASIPETAAEEYDALPLREAIRRLPPELRDVVILRYFAGLTLAETARSLDIPQGTASTRQQRALRLLRLELAEEE